MGRINARSLIGSLARQHWLLTIRLASTSEYREIVNTHLSDLARGQYEIDLGTPGSLNFVGIAEASAVTAGLPNSHEAAFVLLDNVVTRAPSTTDLTGLNRDFVRRSLLANLVHHLRDQRQSLAKVLVHPVVTELMDRYSISEADVEAYYRGKPANKPIKNIERLWKPSGRGNVFESYDPKKGSFPAFLKKILTNEARDLWRVYDRESEVLNHALRLKSDSEDEDRHAVDPERSHEFSVDPSDEIETHLMIENFRRKLRLKNPRYLDLLRLLKDEELDISRSRDEAAIQRALGLKDRAELHRLRDGFLRDLKLVFQNLGADAPAAESLLRAASRRSRMIASSYAALFPELQAICA